MLSLHSCPLGELGSRDTGGMSVYIREVASEIGKHGHSVDIYTRAHDPLDKQVYHLDQNVRLIHLQVGQVEQMHKLVLYAHLDDAACAVENYRKNNGLQYDLIHSHYWLSGWVGRRIQAWWQVPHITMFHTLGAVKNTLGVGEEEPDLRIVTENELVRDSDLIIAPTNAEKDELIYHYNAIPGKVRVIPCGVNLGSFRHTDRVIARQHLGLNGKSIILFVGRIEPLKGIDRLLRAITELDTGREVELIIVGGDNESRTEVTRLRDLSQKLNIADSVKFTGSLQHEDLPLYYSAADVCVVPSYYESFGLVALESLACGTPVVATKAGGIANVVRQGQTGYVTAGDSPSELAAGISRFLPQKHSGSPTNDAKMIRESVSQFRWACVAAALIEEYKAISVH